MTDITLNDITSGYNVSRINANFTTLEGVVNNELLHLVGGNNTMEQDLDMNGYALLNVASDLGNPDSMLTVGAADSRYLKLLGGQMQGPLNMGQNTLTNLPTSVAPTDAVPKSELTAETASRVSADQSLQDQLLGVNPPMGSAFSAISWHGQTITNSIVIPDNVNAWSFGPTMEIAVGQEVVIGTGSFWTIANGEVVV